MAPITYTHAINCVQSPSKISLHIYVCMHIHTYMYAYTLGVVGRPRHQHGHAHTLPDTFACPHLPTPALAVYRCTLDHSTPSTPHAVLHQTRPPCLPSGPPRAMGRPCTLTTLEHTRPSYTRLSAGARSSSRMPMHSCHSHTTRANYAQHTSCAIYIYLYMYIYLYICAAEL